MTPAMTDADPNALIKGLLSQIRKGILTWVLPTSPIAAYTMGHVLGLTPQEVNRSLVTLLPPVLIFWAAVYPSVFNGYLVRRALREDPADQPGDRLKRILKVPWQITAYVSTASWGLGGVSFCLPACLMFGKDPLIALIGGGVGLFFSMLLGVATTTKIEALLMPVALEESRKHPSLLVQDSGLFWPRQSWFLPYAFALTSVTAMFMGCVIVVIDTHRGQDEFVKMMEQAGNAEGARMLGGLASTMLSHFTLPAILIGGFLVVVPTISAWRLARRQASSSREVLIAIEHLSQGKLRFPDWISTDEIGDLAIGLIRIVEQLQAIPLALKSSATKLVEAGSNLSVANEAQRQSITQQAAALQEASVTAAEIKQTSSLAAQRAESVLTVTNRADELGRSGVAALEQTLLGFAAVRDVVIGIREKVLNLDSRARQIGDITLAVKDLADQSNMLALNAAIEAVRSGEHGKGFGVVAREIRALADQSIRATQRIREVLDEVAQAIGEAVAMSDMGAKQVETGLEEAKTSGQSLRELSEMVKESSSAVRQIAAAVSQQNAGFSQIFIAIGELSKIMDQTVSRLDTSQDATVSLQNISEQVGRVAAQYELVELASAEASRT